MSKIFFSERKKVVWAGVINDEEKSPCHGKKQQIRCHGLFSFRSSHFYAPLGFRFFPTERFAQLLRSQCLKFKDYHVKMDREETGNFTTFMVLEKMAGKNAKS